MVQVSCSGASCLSWVGSLAYLNAGDERVDPALDLLGHDTLGGVQLGEDWAGRGEGEEGRGRREGNGEGSDAQRGGMCAVISEHLPHTRMHNNIQHS